MARRLVVKVGSSSLTYATGKLNLDRIGTLVRDIADLRNEGHEVALVTSGAQSAGIGRLNLTSRPQGMPERQAVAAVGQGLLMQIYSRLFAEYGVTVAQVLLTRDDLKERRRYTNARNALGSLFAYGVVPIINENDTVAVDELRFGENDTLSALVASLVDADLLVILTDMEGLYSTDPRTDPNARLIAAVDEITPEIEALAGGVGSSSGSGGMHAKIQAAKIATASGIPMVIAHSALPGVLRLAMSGESVGTMFGSRHARPVSRKRWLVFGRPQSGVITVDPGAAAAVASGVSSLLPGGICHVSGDFGSGDVVTIANQEGQELARGVSSYGRPEIELIMGVRSAQISAILGYKGPDEVVHRDNLICL